MRAIIDDPAAIEIGRELMHAPWSACADADAAAAGAPSPWVLALDGDWAFRLFPRPADVPDGCELPGYDDAGWARLPVPSNWELHGHGEAIYQNIAYPCAVASYPAAPADNPTGCYRTAFSVPEGWAGRRVFIEFGSVDSACRVWLNGAEVGFSTDSKLPAHFELTGLLHPGRNLLAVRVWRWPASAWLEKQDYWHLSGIQRGVRLVAKPPVHLRDWSHRVAFDAGFRDATLEARAWISRPPGDATVVNGGFVALPAAGWTVAFTLLDAAGTRLAAASAPVACESPMYGPAAGGRHAEALSAAVELAVPSPRWWSAEDPALHTLLLELRDPSGAAVDWERVRIGFRQLAIADGELRLNGRRLVVRGVNRHEFHPERGRAVTTEDMRADLLAMKRLNFNAVRTCHYPDHEAWYELCDELGMYVVDEANLETHGLGAMASRDPAWAPAYLQRALRLCLRDRNHPCVIAWSLGNESHVGPHHAAMAAWLRAADPTRPVQYESGFPGPAVSDLMAPMYPSLEWVRRILADPAERRPLVMCEYAYAKGNSGGNLREFWDLVWELPRFQGGFVWDWRDKALARRQGDGSLRWDYGAPHIEPAHTERMCLNGVVGPDLVEHPGAWELAHVQAPVLVTAPDAGAGRIRVANRHQFIDLGRFRLRWRVHEDGRVLAAGTLPCPALPPGAAQDLDLPLPAGLPAPGAERFLEVAVEQAGPAAWAPAGHRLAAWQFTLAAGPAATAEAPREALAIDGGRLSGPGWSLELDPASGLVAGLAADGRQLLTRPLAPCLLRAPTDIDHATGGGGYAAQWRSSGLSEAAWRCEGHEVLRLDAARALVRTRGVLAAPAGAALARLALDWTVHGSGDLVGDIACQVVAPVDTVARIGLATALAGAGRTLRWLGRGPHENYPDRRDSAAVDLHQLPVGELLTPYVFPQECGLRCDVRWLALVDGGGGLFAQGLPLLHASALPVRREDLEAAANLADLRRRDETSLHLDGFHLGLGGDTGWSRNVHPQWRLPPGLYRFRLRLRPLRAGDDPAALARQPPAGGGF